MKEDTEVSATKKASVLTMEIYGKVFKEQLMEVIDADKKVNSIYKSACLQFLLRSNILK